ncbi:MAG: hypothetical protein CMN31_16685 [Sandaracinus sp.]|nr:hypothetical protein [Sandaracinus sp.]MBJ72948.1 hypothetical protein [Sandaracinus sp.]
MLSSGSGFAHAGLGAARPRRGPARAGWTSRPVVLLGGVIALSLSAASFAAAQTPEEGTVDASAESAPLCRPRRAFLSVRLPGAWVPGQRGAVVAELRAALRVQGFDLCLADGRWPEDREPVAQLALEVRRAGVVRIVVRDVVTDKHVWRELPLAEMPPDSRPLAVAIAADELLRASWAELLLADAPPPAEEPPPEVRAVVERAAEQVVERETAARPWWLSLAFAVERYGGGERHLGGSLRLERWVHPRVGLRLALGARGGLTTDGQRGAIESRVLAGDLTLLGTLWGDPSDGPQAVVLAGLAVRWVRFRGVGDEGVSARTDAGVAAFVRGGAGLRWAFGPLRLGLEAGLGAPIAGVAALEDGEAVTAVSELEVHGSLSLGVRL